MHGGGRGENREVVSWLKTLRASIYLIGLLTNRVRAGGTTCRYVGGYRCAYVCRPHCVH